MNTTISNNNLPKFPPATSTPGSGSTTTATASAGSSVSVETTGDRLKLTDSALALQQASRLDDTAGIDPQRVEKVRQALADGSYQVNAGRIADRMLALEQQIEGAGKA